MPKTKPKPISGLERLLAKALLTELYKGNINEMSVRRWAKRVTRKINKSKLSELA